MPLSNESGGARQGPTEMGWQKISCFWSSISSGSRGKVGGMYAAAFGGHLFMTGRGGGA